MAGHALAMADGFPDAEIIGVEPTHANDFQLSLQVRPDQRLPRDCVWARACWR